VGHLHAVNGLRQQGQKGGEVLGVELLGRGELPEHRPQLVAQLAEPLGHELLDRLPGLGQHTAVGGEAAALDRVDEPLRRLVAPLLPTVGLEAGIVGAVDLDRAKPAAHVAQLVLLLDRVRIEHPAPGLERPAADADADFT